MGTPEANTPDNQYESFYASERFMKLADVLLRNSEVKTDGQNTRTTTDWVDQNTKDYYELYKDTRQIYLPFMGMMEAVNYRIFKYSPYSRNPKAPSEVYHCIQEGHLTHPIRKTDGGGNPIVSAQFPHKPAKEALEILANRAPYDARRIMDDKFHERFQQSVGQYILSHLAYKDTEEGAMQPVNHDNVVDAAIKFAKRTIQIEDQVAHKSEAANRDNPDKHQAVVDAIRSKPGRGRRDSAYRQVDGLESAMAVSKKLGGYWHRPYIKKSKKRPPEASEDNA